MELNKAQHVILLDTQFLKKFFNFFSKCKVAHTERGHNCLAFIDFDRSDSAILLSHAQVLNFLLDRKSRLSFEHFMPCCTPKAQVAQISLFGTLFNSLETEFWTSKSVL